MRSAADAIAVSPHVAILTEHPAAAFELLAGRALALVMRFGYQVEERLVAFAQVKRFYVPIVHFRIDIGSVIAAPRRAQMWIPYALQISCLSAAPRRRYHKISAEVEKFLGKAKLIFLRLELL